MVVHLRRGPTGSVHLVSLASRPRCCHGCCQRSRPSRSASRFGRLTPHDVRGRSVVTLVRRLQTCLVPSKPERLWRLKIARAEHHLSDLRHLVESYQDGHHYRAVCPNPRRPTHWRFVLEITEPPDPQIAVVLGDLLFNVRSALDHVAVACAPSDRKRQAGFPLYEQRPEGDDRKKFESMTRGMASEALAAIEYEQPYNCLLYTSDACLLYTSPSPRDRS